MRNNEDKLKGIVDKFAIERKCKELEFNEKAFDDWVDSLGFKDTRGLADLEWNETVTKEQKHLERVKTLAKIKRQDEKAAAKKERDEKQRIRDEERQKKKDANDARRQERNAKKQAERDA